MSKLTQLTLILLLTLLVVPLTSAQNDHLVSDFNPFTTNGVLSGLATRIFGIQSDGKIVTAKESGNGILFQRFNSDGSPDNTFGSGSLSQVDFPALIIPSDIGFQSDGKIVIGGSTTGGTGGFDDPAFALGRIHSNGSRDFNFNFTVTHLGDRSAVPEELLVQPDDKIILGGDYYDCGLIGCGENDVEFLIVRHNVDGGLDSSFDGDGKVTMGFGGKIEYFADMALQADGKLVVIGRHRDTFSLNDEIAVARLHPDGSLDSSFDGDGKLTRGGIDWGLGGAVQADGKILVNGIDHEIMRLNADGSTDTTFGDNGILTPDTPYGLFGFISDIDVQPNGKLLVLGTNETSFPERFLFIASYALDGSLDTTFAEGIGAIQYPIADDGFGGEIEIALDGRIVAATSEGGRPVADLIRLFPEGSFDTGGWVTSHISHSRDFITDILIESDSQIVAVGGANYTGHAIARYDVDGQFDTTLNGTGYLVNDEADLHGAAIAVRTDSSGRLFVLSIRRRTTEHDLMIARHLPNGDIDPFSQFFDTAVFGWNVDYEDPTTFEFMSDGSMLIAGSADGDGAVTKLFPTGYGDTTYGTLATSKVTLAEGSARITDMAVLPDDKALVLGQVNGKVFLYRLGTDGELDPTFNGGMPKVFNFGGISNIYPRGMVPTPSGQFIISGDATVSGVLHLMAMRVNADGTHDLTYGENNGMTLLPYPGNEGRVYDLVLDEDGSLLVSGCAAFDPSEFLVTRFHPDGTFNEDFGHLYLQETPTWRRACATNIAFDPSSDEFVLGGYVSTPNGDMDFALARIERGVSIVPTAVTLQATTTASSATFPSVMLFFGLLLVTIPVTYAYYRTT